MFKTDILSTSKVTVEDRKEQLRKASARYTAKNREKRNKANLLNRIQIGHVVRDETLQKYGLDPADLAFVVIAPGLKVSRYVQKPTVKDGRISSRTFDVTQ